MFPAHAAFRSLRDPAHQVTAYMSAASPRVRPRERQSVGPARHDPHVTQATQGEAHLALPSIAALPRGSRQFDFKRSDAGPARLHPDPASLPCPLPPRASSSRRLIHGAELTEAGQEQATPWGPCCRLPRTCWGLWVSSPSSGVYLGLPGRGAEVLSLLV